VILEVIVIVVILLVPADEHQFYPLPYYILFSIEQSHLFSH